jgi:glutaminase
VKQPRARGWCLACACALALSATGCATSGGTADPAVGSGTVALTPPPDPATGFVLATQTTGAPAAQPAPPGDPFRDALADAFKTFKALDEGKNADYIPALAKVDPKLYGLALVTVQGAIYEIGSARITFSIQSVEKPFTLARAIETAGPDVVNQRIGVNATGQKANSILAIELLKNIPSNKEHVIPAGNPLVNAGAITTVDLLPAAQGFDKWQTVLANLEAFAGRALKMDDEVYRSETETNTHDQAIVQLLKDYEVIKGDPVQALDIYRRACSVSVTARDLAVMGATLANGGKNPLSGEQVVAATTAAKVLAVVSTAGMYETTGEWLYKVGVPAKSGVGGGIVAIVPGRFAVGTFAPPLDPAGNSVRGQRAIAAIMEKLGGSVFASKPSTPARRTGAAAPAPAPATAPPAAAVARGGN